MVQPDGLKGHENFGQRAALFLKQMCFYLFMAWFFTAMIYDLGRNVGLWE